MKALKRKSHDNAILILGGSGSGKSTVLRKLAKDLLREVNKTDKIPLYINLRDWDIEFDRSSPPQLSHLLDFIKDNLKLRLGGNGSPGAVFIDDYFQELYHQGCFYFILDSFDKIPVLLDEPDSSKLVSDISSLLYSICAHDPNIKIILSSREIRQPTEEYRTHTRIYINPFSAASWKRCLKNYKGDAQLASKLISERKLLMNQKKSPFDASLLLLYFNDKKELPQNEAVLYDDFIQSKLEKCEWLYRHDFADNALTVSEIKRYAQTIAGIIFSERNKTDIQRQALLDNGIPEYVIDILKKSGLIRAGSGARQAVSFSHRGIHEYFVACDLISREISVHYGNIFSDIKWRDTLAMYAQMCSDDQAEDLARFCCSYFKTTHFVEKKTTDHKIKKRSKWTAWLIEFLNIPKPNEWKIVENDNFLKAEHALRFLTDAFSSRPDSLLSFQEEITNMASLLLDENNIINRKYHEIAVQATAILPEEKQSYILEKILTKNISWLNETAIQNCAYLKKINSNMFERIIRYFAFMESTVFFKNIKRNLFYIFNLSSGKLKGIYIFQSLLMAWALVFVLIIGVFACIDPARYFSFIEFIVILILCGLFKIIFSWLIKKDFPNELGFQYNVADFLSLLISYPLLLVYVGIFSLSQGQTGLGLMCLLFPTNFCAYFYVFRWARNSLTSVMRVHYRFILFISVVALLCLGLVFLWIYLMNLMPILLVPVSILILIVILVLAPTHSLVKYLNNFFKDKRKFRTLDIPQTIDKNWMTDMLNDLRTAYYQKKFLKLLEEKVCDSSVIGEWENLKFSNIKKHALIQMLTEIKEIWLGQSGDENENENEDEDENENEDGDDRGAIQKEDDNDNPESRAASDDSDRKET
jgi:hypothetical protein